MEDDETRNTADLLEVPYLKPVVYVWRGQELQGHEWVASDAPQGGDSVRLGALDMRRADSVHDATADDVRYLEIAGTAWSDYSGSTYTRSNARSLRRDFGDHVITLTADFGFEVLLVRLDAAVPVGLYEAIVELRDYAIYDEGDLSELESELEQEDWESWGRSDWTSKIRDFAQRMDRDDDVIELDDDAFTDELFWAVCADGEAGVWEAETATSGRWTDFQHAADLGWAELRRQRMAAWEEWARELAAQIPGQLLLPL